MFTQQKLGHEPHKDIDHIFKSLFPKQGMAERAEQIDLAHRMLDAMLGNKIGLSDAGTGIGKTYAYLVAGVVFLRYRATCRLAFQPIIISTSSIALQSAIKAEYLPFLSKLMMENGFVDQPIQAVIRKGKSHYVCDRRLKRRLKCINFSKKNPAATAALRSLSKYLDVDEALHLSGYDRERVCVPKACDCKDGDCRYRRFLENCETGRYPFQICNHNLLLADSIHRRDGRRPILANNLKNNLSRVSESARAQGRYGNVFLTEAEVAELQADFPAIWQEYIERLSEYMASTGKTYQSHAATIRRWAREDRHKGKGVSDYSCKEDESL